MCRTFPSLNKKILPNFWLWLGTQIPSFIRKIILYIKSTIPCVFFFLQAKTRWGNETWRTDSGQGQWTEKTGTRIRFNMPDLSQNQIRRWYWAYLQLLQCKMLCKMWRKSGITVKQGMHFTNTVMVKKCATVTIVILCTVAVFTFFGCDYIICFDGKTKW